MHQFSVRFSRLPPSAASFGRMDRSHSARLPRVSFKHHFGALMTHAVRAEVQPRTRGHRRPLDLDHLRSQGLVPACPAVMLNSRKVKNLERAPVELGH